MTTGPLSTLERLLSPFAKMKPGEGLSAVALSANVFLLLSAYYLIKPVREALILSSAGAEIKSYASIGQMILLAVLVPLYAAVASRVSTSFFKVAFSSCGNPASSLLKSSIHLDIYLDIWA